ncbi:unnamed protein product [Cuscuta epithymum]|uniref:F-box domain-containing protein n=1 Tax=Cuscuta epithymum TaxID=186058 RepID=A0AAV0EBE0_9ASTE|nr:unnamed protein product [Cuscuta epithymum]
MPSSLPSLPVELKIEILTRLPLKYLIRFTAVSKSWLSFLSSSDFVSAHMSKGTTQFFCVTKSDPNIRRFALIDGDNLDGNPTLGPILRPDREFPFTFSCFFNPKNSAEIELVGSFGGLLCLCFLRPESHPLIMLWNPSIRRHLVLPPPSILPPPRKGSHAIGFCVARDGDYRVVWVHDKIMDNPMSVEIYSLNSGKWRIRRFDHDLFPLRWLYSGQVILHGRVHWVGFDEDVGDDYLYFNHAITSFDIDEEIFRDIPVPGNLTYSLWDQEISIALVRESLGLMVSCDHFDCDIWVMQDYGIVDSWTWLYKIDFTPTHEYWPPPIICALNTWETEGGFSGSRQLIYYADDQPYIVPDAEYGDHHLDYVTKYLESLVLLGNKDAVADVHLLQDVADSGSMVEENAGGGQAL